ncbi:ABC transporter permease [Actinomyces faecalis]|uniref:ABC transporter permease n=1 Tax=Actinomyces faecalis TaxID=2722820 RepID=UPI001555B0C9|nr:ABC transporter permease [Actinomyces faecalis]
MSTLPMTDRAHPTTCSASAPADSAPVSMWAWTLPTISDKSSTHLVDAFFGVLLTFRALPGIPASLPVSDLAGIVFILILLFRAPRYRLGRAELLIPGAIAMGVYLIAVSSINDVLWTRRLGHIAILLILAVLIGSGRAHLPSMLRAAAFGILVNTGLFYAGAAPDTYGGYLTGYLEDKNHAALTIAIIGVTLCAFVRRRYIIPTLATTGILIWLTGSRTTLGALAAAGLWILFRPRMRSLIPRVILGGFIAFALNILVDDYSQEGAFTDRTGSDALRERIDDAVQIKLNSTPPYGGGLGTATVEIDEKTWFFHNAYDGLRQEGGWLLLIVFVSIFVWYGLRPKRQHITNFTQLAVEAAVIVELVCAWKLGEVFFSTQTVLLLAAILEVYLKDQDPERAQISTASESTMSRYHRSLARSNSLKERALNTRRQP